MIEFGRKKPTRIGRGCRLSSGGRRRRVSNGPLKATIVIMAKEPVMGRVKTRLGKAIGPVKATYFYRHAARALLQRLYDNRRWQIILSVAPDSSRTARFWPGSVMRRRQGAGDLGQRMQRIFHAAPPGPVLIVGTDIPQIKPRHLDQALKQLGKNEGVLGPAADGGFWLVGQTGVPRHRRLFDHVRWSTAHTLDDTKANLKSGKWGCAGVLHDVDERADFERVRAWAGRVVLPLTANNPGQYM